MDQMTQQNAAMVEESTAASRALADEGRTLSRTMGRFTVADAEATPTITRLRAAGG
jgi:methyl-accepting chemotaxis protein